MSSREDTRPRVAPSCPTYLHERELFLCSEPRHVHPRCGLALAHVVPLRLDRAERYAAEAAERLARWQSQDGSETNPTDGVSEQARCRPCRRRCRCLFGCSVSNMAPRGRVFVRDDGATHQTPCRLQSGCRQNRQSLAWTSHASRGSRSRRRSGGSRHLSRNIGVSEIRCGRRWASRRREASTHSERSVLWIPSCAWRGIREACSPLRSANRKSSR